MIIPRVDKGDIAARAATGFCVSENIRTIPEWLPQMKRLTGEGCLLLQMGIGKPLIAQAMLLANEHGTTVE